MKKKLTIRTIFIIRPMFFAILCASICLITIAENSSFIPPFIQTTTSRIMAKNPHFQFLMNSSSNSNNNNSCNTTADCLLHYSPFSICDNSTWLCECDTAHVQLDNGKCGNGNPFYHLGYLAIPLGIVAAVIAIGCLVNFWKSRKHCSEIFC